MRQLPDGYRVRYRHERAYYDDVPPYIQDSYSLSPKGGKTIARIFDAENSLVAEGIALCSDKDNFSRPTGRSISCGRALKALHEGTQQRPIKHGSEERIGTYLGTEATSPWQHSRS